MREAKISLNPSLKKEGGARRRAASTAAVDPILHWDDRGANVRLFCT
jgi:hypothetical protein